MGNELCLRGYLSPAEEVTSFIPWPGEVHLDDKWEGLFHIMLKSTLLNPVSSLLITAIISRSRAGKNAAGKALSNQNHQWKKKTNTWLSFQQTIGEGKEKLLPRIGYSFTQSFRLGAQLFKHSPLSLSKVCMQKILLLDLHFHPWFYYSLRIAGIVLWKKNALLSGTSKQLGQPVCPLDYKCLLMGPVPISLAIKWNMTRDSGRMADLDFPPCNMSSKVFRARTNSLHIPT